MSHKQFKKFSQYFSKRDWDAYNTLNLIEKQNFKDWTELQDQIIPYVELIEEHQENDIMTVASIYFETLAREAGYKKPYGKKSLSHFKETILEMDINDDTTIIFLPPRKKNHRIAFRFISSLIKFNTERGPHYVVKPLGSSNAPAAIISSHLLKRYKERMSLSQKESCVQIIKKIFLDITMKDTHIKYSAKDTSQHIIAMARKESLVMHTETGSLFGVPLFGSSRPFMYYRTFISLEAMGPGKLEKHAQAYMDAYEPV